MDRTRHHLIIAAASLTLADLLSNAPASMRPKPTPP